MADSQGPLKESRADPSISEQVSVPEGVRKLVVVVVCGGAEKLFGAGAGCWGSSGSFAAVSTQLELSVGGLIDSSLVPCNLNCFGA